MRWPIYAWMGGGCLDTCLDDCEQPGHATMHLWARVDAHDEGVFDPVRFETEGAEDYPGFVSGVAMPLDVYDALVVIRYAQLVRSGHVTEVVRRVASDGFGNVGTHDLARLLGRDPIAEFRSHLNPEVSP